jgi:hypothetical protein
VESRPHRGAHRGRRGSGVAGAGLIFGSQDEYVGAHPGFLFPRGGPQVDDDLAHARDVTDARVGVLLLGAGFVGQAVSATPLDAGCVLPYVVAAVVLLAAWPAHGRIRDHVECGVYLAHLRRWKDQSESQAKVQAYYRAVLEREGRRRDLDRWARRAIGDPKLGQDPRRFDDPPPSTG